MYACRRIRLFLHVAALILPLTPVLAVAAQERLQREIEVRIEHRKVVAPDGAVQISEGDVIALRWTIDEPVEIHLHGYSLKVQLRPDKRAAMVIEAGTTGRFPITNHGWGEGSHGLDALTYLEVYPT